MCMALKHHTIARRYTASIFLSLYTSAAGTYA